MDILYFHQHFCTPRGSVGTRSYEMATHLVKVGHRVTMICGSYSGGNTGLDGSFAIGSRRGVVNGIDVIEFDLAYSNDDGFLKRTYWFMRYALKSIKLALSCDYDVIVATSTPLTAGIPGICARWLRRKAFVFEVRDLWPELPRAMGVVRNPVVLGMMSLLEWLSYRSATRLIGLSPGIVDGIARHRVSRDRIVMIPNACDLYIFGHGTRGPRPPGVRDSDLMTIFSGTHGFANGLDAVLDAAAELKRRGRGDIKLVLIGQGRLKSRLIQRADNEMLTNVIFLEPIDKLRLAGLLASADLGLQILANVPAFYFGTSPNKFFDYIASSLPVLTNYPGWIAEIIREHDIGLVVEPENPAAFADALEKVADDRAQLEPMGERARLLAESQFSRPELATKFENWLEGAVPRSQ